MGLFLILLLFQAFLFWYLVLIYPVVLFIFTVFCTMDSFLGNLLSEQDFSTKVVLVLWKLKFIFYMWFSLASFGTAHIPTVSLWESV